MANNSKPTNSALAVLLGADRGRIKLVPKRKVEIIRLSEIAGEPVVFTVRGITPDEHEDAREAAMTLSKRGEVEELDSRAFQRMVIQVGLVDPPLGDDALLKAFDVATPDDLLARGEFLLVGEMSQLQNAILECSGFGDAAVKQVKN